MIELTNVDLHFVVSRMPKDIRELIVKNPSILVAGGFIRSTIAGERASDIDLFGPDEETLKTAALDLALKRNAKVHTSKNALTIVSGPRIPVQFITRWCYKNTDNLIESFDFTIAQAAIGVSIDENGKTHWYSVCSAQFYPDLAARRLTYTFPQRNEDAGGSMMRMRKFVSKGYTIQAPSMAGVLVRLVRGIDFKKLEGISGGEEREVARMVCNLLREVDPLFLIDGVDLVDEHELLEGMD